jgi:hypothetical protein
MGAPVPSLYFIFAAIAGALCLAGFCLRHWSTGRMRLRAVERERQAYLAAARRDLWDKSQP